MLLHLLCLGAASTQPVLEPIGRYETGIFNKSAAEIAAYDPESRRLFVTNAATNALDVLDLADPSEPALEFSIALGSFGGGVNSVAVRNGAVAVAIGARTKTDAGSALLFNTDGSHLATIETGALPDMIAFSPDGRWLLTADEGEPNDDYSIDPPGSVTIIELVDGRPGRVRHASFDRFDEIGVPEGVRVFGPNAKPSQDLEPEYVTFAPDSRTAYVSLQENNAIAVVDIVRGEVTELLPLGAADQALPGQELDASDRDAGVNLRGWPVLGMRQPDTIAACTIEGNTYILTANEGDPRSYDTYDEAVRVGKLTLDQDAFPDAHGLQRDENLGRLQVTRTLGDDDGDGDFDRLFAFGARSLSVFTTEGRLVADTGSLFERVTAERLPEHFNSDGKKNGSFDSRSDVRGPEPEALAVGVVSGRTLAFVGLERMGGIVTLDLSDPGSPGFVGYTTTRDFKGDPEHGTAGDLAPEGLVFIDAADSPTGEPLLIATHEVSGSVTVFAVRDR